MNEQERIQHLTRRYFWQQKTKEILIVVGIFIAITMSIYVLGNFILYLYPQGIALYDCSIVEKCYTTNIWLIGVVGLAAIIISLLILIVIGSPIKMWIQSNWEEAEEKARGELR